MINKKHIALAIVGLIVILSIHQRNAQQAAIQAESTQRLAEMRKQYRQNRHVKNNGKQEHATPALVLPEKKTKQESPERRAKRLDLARRLEENNAMSNAVSGLILDDASRHRKLNPEDRDETGEQIKTAERNNRIDRKVIYMMSKVLDDETRQLIREVRELYGIDPDNSTQKSSKFQPLMGSHRIGIYSAIL